MTYFNKASLLQKILVHTNWQPDVISMLRKQILFIQSLYNRILEEKNEDLMIIQIYDPWLQFDHFWVPYNIYFMFCLIVEVPQKILICITFSMCHILGGLTIWMNNVEIWWISITFEYCHKDRKLILLFSIWNCLNYGYLTYKVSIRVATPTKIIMG